MSTDAAAGRFLRVLDAENRLLAVGDMSGATALVAEKQATAAALQAALKTGALSQDLATELRARTEENADRLRLAIVVQARILEMVAQASLKARAGGSPGGYGRPGGRGGPVAARPGALAVALRA